MTDFHYRDNKHRADHRFDFLCDVVGELMRQKLPVMTVEPSMIDLCQAAPSLAAHPVFIIPRPLYYEESKRFSRNVQDYGFVSSQDRRIAIDFAIEMGREKLRPPLYCWD